MAASAYIDPVADPSGRLMAADIETIFRKSAGRLVRDRVRKRLDTKVFPHPFERALWPAKGIADWLPSAGRMECLSLTSLERATCSGSQQSSPKTLASLKPGLKEMARPKRFELLTF